MKRTALNLAVGYLLLLVMGCVAIALDDGSHWAVTLFLFSPRWIAALPMIVLIPITMTFRFRFTLFYLLHALVVAFPIMGYQIPRTLRELDSKSPTLGVITCNLGGGSINTGDLIDLVHEHEIEVLMLQECPATVSVELFKQLGWEHRQEHALAIGSSFPLGRVVTLARHPKSHYNVPVAISCDLSWPMVTTSDGSHERVQLVSLHLPTFRPALEVAKRLNLTDGPAAIQERGVYYREIADQLFSGIRIDEPTIVGGDFNVPCESAYYRDYWHEYRNAYAEAGIGFGYTKYTRYHGIRIDHLLVNDDWSVIQSLVGPSLGGDHRPVITKLTRSER